MTEYRRNFVKGGSYFFTVALADRRQGLLVDHIDALRGAFRRVKTLYPFTIDAIVILPEHLHCIWTLPEAMRIIPSGGGASREDFHAMCRVAVYALPAKNCRVSVAFGNAVTGNIRCAMRKIGSATWIIFITIRSSIGMLNGLPIGRIPRFIIMSKLVYILGTGQEVGRRVTGNLVRCEIFK